MNNELIIHTSDTIEFKVSRDILHMLNNLQNHIEYNGNIVKLSAVKSSDFKLIHEYCFHHNYVSPALIVRPLKFNELKKCVNDEWDAEFISAIDFEKVTDLLIASELLNCKSLLDLCYARLALFFRVSSTSDLKHFFQLSESEFSENDLKEVKEGNKWLMSLTEDRIKELDSNNN